MKILIVEDDSFYAQFVAETLQDKGIEASGGQVRTGSFAGRSRGL